MAYEADKVVVSLIAENEQFDAATKASAANFQQSMAGIQATGAAAERGVSQFSSALKENRLQMNQSRIGMMEFQHIARGVSDQMAAGAPASQILTQHLGMLGEAVALSGGAFGKFGEFLSGPWGIALTLATVVGTKFLINLIDQKDGLEKAYDSLVKHKEQTALNAQAEDIWSHSLDGLIERTKKLTDQLDRRVQTQTTLNRIIMQTASEEFAAAQAAQARLAADPKATADELSRAAKEVTAAALALHAAQVQSAEEAGAEIASATKAAEAWGDLERSRVQAIMGEHPELAEKAVGDQLVASVKRVAEAIQGAASAGLDFQSTANQVTTLNTELLNGSINAATFEQRMNALARSLAAATEAFKNQDQAISKFKQSVIGAEGLGPNRMGSSAAGYGQFMPSTFEGYFRRLYPQQAAGMSNAQIDALRNNRQVAQAVIDKATDDYVAVLKSAGQQITAASLYTVHLLGAGDAKKLLAAPAGESTSDFLSAAVLRGNPFLVGTAGSARAAIAKRIGDSSGAVSSGAAAIAQAQEEAAKKAAEQQATFTQEMDGLNSEYLKARQSQVKDTLAQLDFQEQEVRAEQQKRDDSFAAAVTSGKLTKAQADQLTAMAASVAAEKLKALRIQEQAEIIQRQDEVAEREAQYKQDDLRAAEQAATSQAQRRELDLAILDILYSEKLLHLERLKQLAENVNDQKTANDLQAQIDRLPDQKAIDRQGVMRQTMDPLHAWLQTAPHDAHAVTEALQGIATNGFDQIANSIAGVITGTQSLGQAFSSIAQQIVGDIIQMTVRMLIFRAVSSFLGGSAIPAPDLNAAWQVDLGPSNPLTVASPDLATLNLPTLAGGGFGVIGGMGGTDNNLLSLNGQPVAWVSQGEGLAIMPSNARAASPWGGANGFVLVKVEANDYFDARVGEVAGPIAAQAATGAAYGGAAMARSNLARRQLHQLGSRG